MDIRPYITESFISCIAWVLRNHKQPVYTVTLTVKPSVGTRAHNVALNQILSSRNLTGVRVVSKKLRYACSHTVCCGQSLDIVTNSYGKIEEGGLIETCPIIDV